MDTSILDIDKKQIPPIHKKRILAFVNHFVIQTASFINKFANECESKFIAVERKIQTVEAALLIVEAKLNSIPGIADKISPQKTITVPPTTPISSEASSPAKETVDSKETEEEKLNETVEEIKGVKACEDYRYKKYFKMVQFGVPPSGVKQKMSAEGFDTTILE